MIGVSDFAEFQMPDGRLAFVRRSAVDAVFDSTFNPWNNMIVNRPADVSIVVLGQTQMAVPYTADRARGIICSG